MKKRGLILLLLLPLFLAGCESVRVNYVGDSFAPTTEIGIFFSKSDIGKPYTIMGRAIGSISDLDETKTLQEHMVQEAKAHGADAILIENMDKRITGEYVDWGGAGTYYGPGGRRYPYGIAGGTSVRDYRQDIEITAVFLKYKTE